MANKKTVKTENKAIELTIEQIEKSFGKGAVMRMNESANGSENIQAISTGSMGLDQALGIGGVPRGRIVEIFGAESAGKSTLADTTDSAVCIINVATKGLTTESVSGLSCSDTAELGLFCSDTAELGLFCFL